MPPVVKVVSERLTLGEGPHWDEETQSLYFVDIFGQAVHKYVPSTNTHTKVNIGKFNLNMSFHEISNFSFKQTNLFSIFYTDMS